MSVSTPNEPHQDQNGRPAGGPAGPGTGTPTGGLVPPWQRGPADDPSAAPTETFNRDAAQRPSTGEGPAGPPLNNPGGPPPRGVVTNSGTAAASMSGQQAPVTKLESLTIEGQTQQEGFKAEQSASRKYTAPLLDTPQTVTVVPAQVIQDQQALSLRSVLSNVSGITFNAGEGGGGSGDSINIRGFSANSNIQIDGLRDSTQTNRTDTFNLESVEVIKGPNSVFGGAGTTGGSINLTDNTSTSCPKGVSAAPPPCTPPRALSIRGASNMAFSASASVHARL